MKTLQQSLLASCTITVGHIAGAGHLTVNVALPLLLHVRVPPHLRLLVHGAEQHVNVLNGWDVGSLLVAAKAAE